MKRYITLAIASAVLAACDARQPLVVRDPDTAPPSELNNPASLPFLHSAVIADFAVGYMGGGDQANNGHEGIADFGAIFTDEYNDFDTFPTRSAMNTRVATASNASLAGVYQDLGAAHNDVMRAKIAYVKFAPTSANLAEVYALDAYVYIYVAEHWCSGEPFSTIDIGTGNITNGAFLSTTQMLDTALARFAAAKAVLASDTASADGQLIPIDLGLAQIGTARALLDLGQVTQAADTAAAATGAGGVVTPGFAYQILGSTNTPRQNSGIWYYSVNFQAFSVADAKNGTGLMFHAANDPRVPWVAPAGLTGSNGAGPFIIQLKVPTAASPSNVADYNEAQLIVAEGDIFAGNYPAALTIMQNLRTNSGLTFPPSTALTNMAGATPKAQMQQLLSERAFWMYITAHRLGDWRRMLRAPYNAAPFSFVTSDVYPVGPGLSSTLEFPTPLFTQPNPNYKACDPTIP
jgi:hypothetical protein